MNGPVCGSADVLVDVSRVARRSGFGCDVFMSGAVSAEYIDRAQCTAADTRCDDLLGEIRDEWVRREPKSTFEMESCEVSAGLLLVHRFRIEILRDSDGDLSVVIGFAVETPPL